MEYYELHITFKGPLKQEPPRPWKYSQIDGDPVLGNGVKAYLTRQVKSDLEIKEVHKLLKEPTKWLYDLGYEILRRKIEKVVYDTKTLPDSLFSV